MSQILHIIGPQGIGKSRLAIDIQASHKARGVSCENLTELGLHEPGMNMNIQHIRKHGFRVPYSIAFTQPDVLIVEHLSEPYPNQVRPGDLLIRLEQAA